MTIKRVAVIGAGPSGLGALKVLASYGYSVQGYEQAAVSGGLWNYSETPGEYSVPSETPHVADDTPQRWTSPMYWDLDTNVDRDTMSYGTLAMDRDRLPLYTSRDETLQYLRQYAEDVVQHVKFQHKVLSVDKPQSGGSATSSPSEPPPPWVVEVEDMATGQVAKQEFDAVMFATGNFNLARVPDRPGLREWSQRYPGSVVHSKAYRRAEFYRGKKVLIVGGSTSGYDISRQLSGVTHTQYHSIRGRTVSSILGDASVRYVPDIASFDAATGAITDVDGQPLPDRIDHVIFATGYLRWYPALEHTVNRTPHPVVTDGERLHNVYQHMFYTPDPTLVFLGTPLVVVPFPLAEIQAIYAACLWKQRCFDSDSDSDSANSSRDDGLLPPYDERVQWERRHAQSHGDGPKFHLQKYPENCEYLDDIIDGIYKLDGPNPTVRPKPVTQEMRRIRAHMVPLRAAHEAYTAWFQHKPQCVQQLIDTGFFEWNLDLV